MLNRDIARRFQEFETLSTIDGLAGMRANAYGRIAEAIATAHEKLAALTVKELANLEGIGKSSAERIRQIVDNGDFPELAELRKRIPHEVVVMAEAKGIGAKKAGDMWRTLNLTTLQDTLRAAQAGQLRQVPGIAAKTETEIAEAIQFVLASQGFLRLDVACEMARTLQTQLEAFAPATQFALAGDLARDMPTVHEIVLVADTPINLGAFVFESALFELEDVAWVAAHPRIRLRVLGGSQANFASTLFQETGPDAFTALFEGVLNETPKTDEAIFAAKGYPYIAPRYRDLAAQLLPEQWEQLADVVQESDLKGVLHCHSTWSDGANTIAEMAAAVQAMGCHYMCITDHSKTAAYAGGLQVERVLRQHAEIDALNVANPHFFIFKGIESDILKDGSLDYDADTLTLFDCIVASVHNGLRMGTEEATKRLVKAVENPYTTVLGHPTGRLLLKRQGYSPDMYRVIDAAAANGTAIEINGSPYRLDLDWTLVHYAVNKGVRIALTSDAHHIDQLAYHTWAVRMAQKGFLPKAMCLNALPLEAFREAITVKRNA